MSDGDFKQTWWDANLTNHFDTFKGWIGDFNAQSKVFVRGYVKSKGYTSIVDCGCGPATEYFGYKNDKYDIDYMGVDSSEFLFNHVKNLGVPAILSPIENISAIADSSYDVAFSRHVLEHLPTYKKGLAEFIRIGRKEVINVFFKKPVDGADIIDFNPELNLYHNSYGKAGIEDFLKSSPKVASWSWHEINEQECALIIIMNG